MATITRTSACPVLAGRHAPTGAALRELLREFSPDSPAVVADLSLGAWRGRAVAHDWCHQLGISSVLPTYGRTLPGEGDTTSIAHADQVANGIDSETRGDVVAVNALELADRVVTHLAATGPRTLVVIAPRWGTGWGRDNALLIRYVTEGLEGQSRVVVVSAKGTPPTRPEWQIEWRDEDEDEGDPVSSPLEGSIGLVPGVLDLSLVQCLVHAGLAGAPAVRLGDEAFVVAPEARVDPRAAPAKSFDLIAAAVDDDTWLCAYATCFGSAELVRSDLLWRRAFQCLAEDGHESALALIDRATEAASTPVSHAMAAAGAQGVRLGLRRYAEAARLEPAPSQVPSSLRAFLLESKGWGLTMSGRADEAEPYLATARSLSSRDVSRERLYLLNISALNRLKLGDATGALDLEREIEMSLAAEHDPDPHLTYINGLNLARLLRRMGDADGAIDQYRRAFRTTLGTTSDSDAVYQHFCLARTLGEARRADESYREWLLAALRWVAADAPEALTPRAVLGIVHALPPYNEIVEQVSGAIHGGLDHAAAEAGLDCAGVADSPPQFVCAESRRWSNVDPASLHGVIVPGVPGLVFGSGACRPVYRSMKYDRLRACVWAYVAPDAARPATVLVDDRFGIGLPLTPAGLLETCLCVGADTASYDGLQHQLDRDRRARLTELLHCELGPAVRDIRDQYVYFYRCRPPRPLTEEEMQLLDSIGSDAQAGVLGHKIDTLRTLERSRVLRLRLSDDDV